MLDVAHLCCVYFPDREQMKWMMTTGRLRLYRASRSKEGRSFRHGKKKTFSLVKSFGVYASSTAPWFKLCSYHSLRVVKAYPSNQQPRVLLVFSHVARPLSVTQNIVCRQCHFKHENQISAVGPLGASIGKLRDLQTLDLSGNKLTGTSSAWVLFAYFSRMVRTR